MKRFILALFLTCFILTKGLFAFVLTEDHKKEIAIKEASVEAFPNNAHAHFDLAMTYAYSNMIQEGLDELNKVQEIDKDFAKKAQKIYRAKLVSDPFSWKLKFRLAFANFFAGDKKGYIKELNEILEFDPYNIWAYGYQALAYGEMGEYDKAIKLCKKALKLDPDVSSIRFALGQAYYKKGQSWHGFWQVAEALRLKAIGK